MKNYRGIVLGLVIVAIVLAGVWYMNREAFQPEDPGMVGDNMEVTDEMMEKFETSNLAVSETAEKVSLLPVDGSGGSGIATREIKMGKFEHVILADLDEPVSGKFYEGWLVRESDTDVVYTGKFEQRKGGWVLEYESSEDLNDHSLVVITLESKDDQKPEAHVLEGRFR